MPTKIYTDGNDVHIYRTVSLLDWHDYALYKFDISSISDTVLQVLFNWRVSLNNMHTDTLNIVAYRAMESAGVSAQSWVETDTAADLHSIAQYTHNNEPVLDNNIFHDDTAAGYHVWNVSSGVRADLDESNTYFSVCLARHDAGTSGTLNRDSPTADTGFMIFDPNTPAEYVQFYTSEQVLESRRPYLDVYLAGTDGACSIVRYQSRRFKL